jgi:hypothetical protein
MKKPTIRDILFVLLIATAAIWLMSKLNKLPSFGDIFASKPVVIDQTPILIKEIKTIAQLVTVTSYDEVVVDSLVFDKKAAFVEAFRIVAPLAMLPSLQKQLVLVAKGKVLAGTNLQKLRPESILIKEDTITLNLPGAEILEAVVNPSDFETFEEKGVWSDTEVTRVKMKARSKMIDRALRQNILTKADNKAKAIMENFLRNAGYKVVYVQTV